MARPRLTRPNSHVREIVASFERERPDLHTDRLYVMLAQHLGIMLDRVFARFCRNNFEINSGDMRVLFALRRAGPDYELRATELFRALLITSGAITKQVDRLVLGGYVARQPLSKKTGGHVISLTAKGLKTADEALTMIARDPFVAHDTLSPEERKFAAVILEKMSLSLEARLAEEEAGSDRSHKRAQPIDD